MGRAGAHGREGPGCAAPPSELGGRNGYLASRSSYRLDAGQRLDSG